MARAQLDFLNEEKRSIRTLLAKLSDIEFSQSWAEPHSASNFHIVRHGSRNLKIEITHKNSERFSLTVIGDMLKRFARDGIDSCNLIC